MISRIITQKYQVSKQKCTLYVIRGIWDRQTQQRTTIFFCNLKNGDGLRKGNKFPFYISN